MSVNYFFTTEKICWVGERRRNKPLRCRQKREKVDKHVKTIYAYQRGIYNIMVYRAKTNYLSANRLCAVFEAAD